MSTVTGKLDPQGWDWEAVERVYRSIGITLGSEPAPPAMMIPNLPDLYRRTIQRIMDHIDPRQSVLLDALGSPVILDVRPTAQPEMRGVKISFVDDRDGDATPHPASKADPMPDRALRPPRDPSLGITLPFDRR